MSSNIIIEKKCQYCEKIFLAKTIHTKYCSHLCNSRDYKRRKREAKVKVAEELPKLTKLIHTRNLVDTSPLNNKTFLSLSEAALYLNVCSATMRQWIWKSVVPASKIGKKYIVRRIDIEGLVEKGVQKFSKDLRS